jgi:ABC-2 type transport system ATP-binding protein
MKNQSEWAIEISGLVKEYGSIRAVDNISFKIPFGVIFPFLGPNGAGKTTTVEMLECLRKPSAGTVDPAALKMLPRAELRQYINDVG